MKKLAVTCLMACVCALAILLTSCNSTRVPQVTFDPATGYIKLTDTGSGATLMWELPEPSK